MTWWVAGATVVGGYLSSQGSQDAAQTQADAANNATAIQNQQYQQTRQDQAPWRLAGENALAKLTGLLQDGSLTSKFAGMNPMEEKGYQFAAQEGQRAIDNSAAARGGIGGASLKAGARFAEDNATKYYDNAFNRFQAERTNTTNPLFQLAGFGAQANQQVGQAGANYANQAGANAIGAGNASAANSIAQGNIYGNTLNQLTAIGNKADWWQNPAQQNPQYGYGQDYGQTGYPTDYMGR
jgi:hypothetical protein